MKGFIYGPKRGVEGENSLELKHIHDNVSYIPGPTNIGVIRCGGEQAVLVDTGIDAQAAKKILKTLEKSRLSPLAVISTHAHADHTGGNAFFQSKFGIPVYTSAGEAPFLQNPVLEPLFLLGGAAPWKEMKNKFLCAPPCAVTILKEEKIVLGEAELTIHRLPGHSYDQIGVSCRKVLFSGDAFIGAEYLKKHTIPYNMDIQHYLDSLDQLSHSGAAWTVPGHGEVLTDTTGVLEENRKTVLQQLETVLELVKAPATLEEVLHRMAARIGLNITSPSIFFLYRTAVTAYLSYLFSTDRVVNYVQDNRSCWEKK